MFLVPAAKAGTALGRVCGILEVPDRTRRAGGTRCRSVPTQRAQSAARRLVVLSRDGEERYAREDEEEKEGGGEKATKHFIRSCWQRGNKNKKAVLYSTVSLNYE